MRRRLNIRPNPAGGDMLAYSTRGMVTSPHALSSEVGQAVLASGGNAIEAAIAMAGVLCVTYPHFCTLGGDAFCIIADRNGRARTISGIGQAAMQLPRYDGEIPVRGPGSLLTAAATVDTWRQAFDLSRSEWGGTRSWSELLEPAMHCAEHGFPLTSSQAFWQNFRGEEANDWLGFSEVFMPGGRAPDSSTRFRQPELALTLRALRERGARDFYDGTLAARIAAGLEAAGSPLRSEDLARCRARSEPPLRVPYRGGELLSLQPPTQGVTTLEVMGILERFDLRSVAEGTADYYHLLVEAIKLAFIDRNRYVADPDFVDVPTATLLAPSHLDERAARIDRAKARDWPDVFRQGDTVYLAAVDAQGHCVSMLQTIYFDFGSGVLVGDTGILWHNRGAAFSVDPSHPNRLAAGKRPFHTLNPGMYLRDGAPSLLYGTQGADGQPQTLTALLTRLIDYNMDPYAALARPRFLLGRTFSDSNDTLKLEEDAGAAVFAALAAIGHEMAPLGARSPLAGHPGTIAIDRTGEMRGAHDPRSDGVALGV
jgi:oxamate amidohydrolase